MHSKNEIERGRDTMVIVTGKGTWGLDLSNERAIIEHEKSREGAIA